MPAGIENQFAVAAEAVKPIADLVAKSAWPDRIVLTHGNGPQVGFQALRSELSRDELFEVPLDSLVADTQGSLGYMLQRALREELMRRGVSFNVVSVVTEVETDPDDQAFKEPTKPIGRFYAATEATQLGRERGWDMVEDPHRGWRRVVPSPAPVRIVQLESIAKLTDQRSIVICCGGGGVPVVRGDDGHIRGLEAVIDMKREKLVLGGFSQGAMLATDVVLRSSDPVAGLVVMSGAYIAEAEWSQLMPSREDLPVFQSHGSNDPLLPVDIAERLRNALVAAGLPVTWVPFSGGHGIAPNVLDRFGDFLATVLG